MKYVKGKATVEVKPPKGTRLIGQCQDCKNWTPMIGRGYHKGWGYCSMPIFVNWINRNWSYGCWYWKEKK